MKKVTLFFMLCPLFLFGQRSQVTSIPIMKQVLPFLSVIEDDYYTINRIEFDLIFKGRKKNSVVYLYEGKKYTLQLIGEQNKIKDIDFKIFHKLDDKWVTWKESNTNSHLATISVIPEASRYYELELNISEGKDTYPGGKYCLIVYYE